LWGAVGGSEEGKEKWVDILREKRESMTMQPSDPPFSAASISPEANHRNWLLVIMRDEGFLRIIQPELLSILGTGSRRL
jgi:hypothetical protein